MSPEGRPGHCPLKLYFYRRGIDFALDDRFCYITLPLALDTPIEPECRVETRPEDWRFHPITSDWRNNNLWEGYRHDPRMFTVVTDPAAADFFVFPYMLEEMIEDAGPARVSAWLQKLPFYAGNASRHVFMTLHDSAERLYLPGITYRASVSRSRRDAAAQAIPYAVEDFSARTHFDPSRIRHEVCFAGFVGCPVSGPVRRAVIASLAKETRIRAFLSPSDRFHGRQPADVRQGRREIFLNCMADSWTVVCPRGTGLNTYRFFETLSMGRIPVLISDDCLLPFEDKVDYDAFMLRVPEKDAGRTAEIVGDWLGSQTTDRLMERCRLARRAWEEHLAGCRWTRRIVASLRGHLEAGSGKIVVDGVIFQLQRGRPFGISRMWRSLLTELGTRPLARRMILLDRGGTAPRIEGIRTRRIDAFRIGSAHAEAASLGRICREERAGVFLSTYYTFAEQTPSVLMLYDMIPERFQRVGPEAPNPEWRDKHHAIMHATCLAAISRSTACDLQRFYPGAASRAAAVVPCAVSGEFRRHSAQKVAAFRKAAGLERPYFLLVGRRDPHKNIGLFFEAFARLPERERYAVVVAGGDPEFGPEVTTRLGGARLLTGFFPDDRLALLYGGALALVYPSRYEGFGLPILEAMQSGCPVITCHNSSLFEVAGVAALYVDEDDPDALASALHGVQQPDVRRYLVRKGLERAEGFSWARSASLLAEVLEARLNESGRGGRQAAPNRARVIDANALNDTREKNTAPAAGGGSYVPRAPAGCRQWPTT